MRTYLQKHLAVSVGSKGHLVDPLGAFDQQNEAQVQVDELLVLRMRLVRGRNKVLRP